MGGIQILFIKLWHKNQFSDFCNVLVGHLFIEHVPQCRGHHGKTNKNLIVVSHVVLCAIWYHSYNLKSVKNTHGVVLLLVKLQASACNFTESNTPPWMFFTFLNCAHGTKSRNAHIWVKILKKGPYKICRRQPLKNFTWSILEYFVP